MARILNLKSCLLILVAAVVFLTFIAIKHFNEDSPELKSQANGRAIRKLSDNSVFYDYNGNGLQKDKPRSKTGGSQLDKAKDPLEHIVANSIDEDGDLKEVLDDFDTYDAGNKHKAVINHLDKNEIKEDDNLDTAVAHVQKKKSIDEITCDINNGKYILKNCKRDDDEVYIPFSFLKKYYEVFGKVSDKDPHKFLWQNSNQYKIYRPAKPYDAAGVYMYFENYNVEVRERVKCISGMNGVPISTQWDRKGYHYPIQIAQFALSHYSKHSKGEKSDKTVLEDADTVLGYWTRQDNDGTSRVVDPLNPRNNVIQFQYTSADEEYYPTVLSLNRVNPHYQVMSMDLMIDVSASVPVDNAGNVNITFTVAVTYDGQPYFLHYVTQNFLIRVEGNNIYHGIGLSSLKSWQHIIRDIWVDLQKGLQMSKRKLKITRSKLVLDSFAVSVQKQMSKGKSSGEQTISFEPLIFLDNFTIANNEHLAQFYQAADWFIGAQDSKGGWPIPVLRKFGPSFYPVLQPGWYSAMAQGHGLSVLARAYKMTGNSVYAKACAKAVSSIFDKPGPQDGVRAVFMEKYVWFEEYPTQPSTFVLNGFMYALLGLYDTMKLNIPEASEKASELFALGIKSLKAMLPLYDTGWGSMYDLKHFSVKGIAPNPARLDYHVTHINQLLVLATIDHDTLFKYVASRWIGYLEGERAPHN